jgi:hypothetical protein
MSKRIRFSRLDGFGEESVDLERCRRFLVWRRRLSPEPGLSLIDETTLQVYYLTPNRRWILGLGGIRQLRSGGEDYIEVHPVMVTRVFLLYEINLPPELEPYREHADGEGHKEWLINQGPGMVGSNEARQATLERFRKASEIDRSSETSDRSTDATTMRPGPAETPPAGVRDDQVNASPVGNQVNAAETNARARDVQSEEDVATAKVRDSQVNDKPKLNKTQRDLIQAAYLLKAFNEGSARSQSQIVKKYDPSKDSNAGNINRAFNGLVVAGLFASREGPDGGRWLTEKGRRIAEESTAQNRQA